MLDVVPKNKLTLTQPSDLEFRVTRAFDAPRALVFRAWTDAKHVRHWWGCGQLELTVCEIDLRVGGSYCFTMQETGGREHTIHGIYRDILAPGRLVYTQAYVTEGFTSPTALVTVTFTEENGRTTLTANYLHDSRADRDGHLASGVQDGAAKLYDQLEAHIRTMGA